MKISLILPVYNVEAYLGQCIETCLHQDLPLSDYEIIVVIDGSPDHSIDISKKYQEANENIKIISTPNGGLSKARNIGLQAASGDYVWFIDSDDYIKENVLGDIVNRLQDNQLDALWLDWQDVNEAKEVLPPFAPHAYGNSQGIYTGKEFMEKILSNFLSAWSFVYRRQFLLEHNLLFTDGMFYEDSDFAFRSLPLVQRIQQYGQVCYYYLQREGSIVHTISMKKLEDISTNCVSATTAIRQLGGGGNLKRFYKVCYTAFYMLFVKEVLKANNKEYANFLIEQTKIHGFGKVCMYGNMKTKLIGALYNMFGIKMTYKIMNILLHLHK